MRKKLIALIVAGKNKCVYGDCEDCAALQQEYCTDALIADYLISKGVTIQKWIPVSDKLPEDDLPKNSKCKQIKVLVAYMRNGNWVLRTNMRKKGQWYGKPDQWDWSVSDPITHWMSLPEPPKK